MNKPQYVKVEDKLYKINTDFRIALECNKICQDKNIDDYERGLAVVYLLFGEEGLESSQKQKLAELGIKYIRISDESKNENLEQSRKKYELDFGKCEGLIRSSFKFDYNYDPYELEYLHWYDFYNDLANLSTSEFGTCCALNRVVSILEQDTNMIKDSKEKSRIIETQKELLNKYCIQEERKITKEQEESAKEFYKSLGIDL